MNIFGYSDFIVWDSEGANDDDKSPQRTILFGCYTPDGHRYFTGHSLNSEQMIDFVLDIAEEYPDAIHVGFAFGYDSNMMLRHLDQSHLETLYEKGKLTRLWGGYTVRWMNGKLLNLKRNSPKAECTIFDVFSFFGTSFVKAAEELLGDSPELALVAEEKKNRGGFADRDIDEVVHYWKLETKLLHEVMITFRKHLFNAGFSKLTQWHGPGAVANLLFEREGIAKHMSRDIPKEVNRAAQYAYAGGRFESFKIGFHDGPIYGYDLNSAYPSAISQLPCLACGDWEHVEHPTTIRKFGVYNVRLRTPDAVFWNRPGPLFYRDHAGNMFYPHVVEGWYWSPEADLVLDHPNAEILEGYEYIVKCDHKPFAWVRDVYRQRQILKKQGNPSQMALKLGLNSLYGKMAQRVGWNERKKLPPKWHQLEWAGWVTSMTRREMYKLIHKTPWENLISVETDGVYSTAPPDFYGIENSKELGEWSVEKYDAGMFLQSGLYFLREGDEWKQKIRGFDKDSFTIDQVSSYLQWQFKEWETLEGKTTRFISLGAALASSEDFRTKHCRWEHDAKDLSPGRDGKRFHFSERCFACLNGLSGYEALHSLVVKHPGGESYPHELPWIDESEFGWRQGELLSQDLIANV